MNAKNSGAHQEKRQHNSSTGPLRKIGLARALSKLGYCSRAKATVLILAGHVRLNGALRRDPETPVRMEKDRIEVHGALVSAAVKTYVLLNKPRGVVTTASDEKGRETVYDYLEKNSEWLAPVGRLDKASEGLLLLTNDSEWAARVTAPETQLEKTYHVQIAALANDRILESLRAGIETGDGDFLRLKRADVLRTGERNSWLEIVLDEGQNRHIRRMLEHLDIEVLRLVRVATGPLLLGELAKGAHRPLTNGEKAALDAAMRLREAQRASR
jgi:23S rRNA pseudouridine2605 synthase